MHTRGRTYGSELKGVNLSVNLKMNTHKIGQTQMMNDLKTLNTRSGLPINKVKRDRYKRGEDEDLNK